VTLAGGPVTCCHVLPVVWGQVAAASGRVLWVTGVSRRGWAPSMAGAGLAAGAGGAAEQVRSVFTALAAARVTDPPPPTPAGRCGGRGRSGGHERTSPLVGITLIK
jgi:hypothetical protein